MTDFERSFHRLMPNLTLKIDDFWLQGYKVGQASIDLERKGKELRWKQIKFHSAQYDLDGSGRWYLEGNNSRSSVMFTFKGENNTDLMDRFGISSGIQKAPFEMHTQVSWQGSPWAVQVETMKGNTKVKFGKGVISDVSGAAKLLGMFSLDSILRKMQLDFSDIFDEGMPFDSISGTGQIEKGIFVTNNLKMDASAGDMLIRGRADLNEQKVDAEVEFTPDLTSGIPVLTAFAVAPQSAIFVLAISKVLSPVIDVFTKIRYQIKGPFDSPEVKELSRSQGEYKFGSK